MMFSFDILDNTTAKCTHNMHTIYISPHHHHYHAQSHALQLNITSYYALYKMQDAIGAAMYKYSVSSHVYFIP